MFIVIVRGLDLSYTLKIFGNINSNSIEPVTHRDTLIIYNSLFAKSDLELIPQDVHVHVFELDLALHLLHINNDSCFLNTW